MSEKTLSRRDMLKLGAATGALSVFPRVALSAKKKEGPPETREKPLSSPNIVLIMFDQMRHDAGGFAGNHEVITPVMDQFAKEGVCFEQAHCGSPLCSPARASWLSGLYPHSHLQLDNYNALRKGKAGFCLPREIVTISDVLNKARYCCGMAGPWHLGYDELPQHGYNGMWRPYKYPEPREADAYRQWLVRHNMLSLYEKGKDGKRVKSGDEIALGESFVNVSALPTKHQRTTWAVNQGIEFLDETTGPFFFFLSIKDPHSPILPPQEFYDLYDPSSLTLPRNWRDDLKGRPDFLKKSPNYGAANFTPEVLRDILAHYYALISHVDNQVGRLMAALKKNGQDENTIVAIISDHGDMMGEHGFFTKRLMYEGSVRVPCLLRWPGRLKAGARIREPFAGVDLMPTLLELAGAELPPMHGRSMAQSALTGKEPETNTVFSEILASWPLEQKGDLEDLAVTMMARKGDWKYILHRVGPCSELYNLAEDPGEMTNRASDPAARAVREGLYEKMRERLRKDGPGPYKWVLKTGAV